jgi:hypothetical protein
MLQDENEIRETNTPEGADKEGSSKPYNMINSPSHYNDFSIETWDMMLRIWGDEAFITFCEINAFKYKMRAGSKPHESADQDLKKANWYLNKARELKDKSPKW